MLDGIGSYATARKNGASVGHSLIAGGVGTAITFGTASISGAAGDDLLAATMMDATVGLGGGLCNSAATTAITNWSVGQNAKGASSNGGWNRAAVQVMLMQ